MLTGECLYQRGAEAILRSRALRASGDSMTTRPFIKEHERTYQSRCGDKLVPNPPPLRCPKVRLVK